MNVVATRRDPRDLPLCAHAEFFADPRNSVLDAPGDVVLFHGCDGIRHLFRDNHPDGLILTPTEDGWTLTRETYTCVVISGIESCALVAEPAPVCAAAWNTLHTQITARHLPTGRVILRASGQYGLMARAARFYLRSTPKKSERAGSPALRRSPGAPMPHQTPRGVVPRG
ncbi:MAG TPA: hypothetical protein VF755_04700 [Catenuloplanes sp.]|jgi:hypothetical protein